MNENENEGVNGLCHNGDSPVEIGRQVHEAFLRLGTYVHSDRFMEQVNIYNISVDRNINRAKKNKGRKELVIDKDSSGLFWFTYSEELEEDMRDLRRKKCYLCGTGLDNLYCYIIKKMESLIPSNFHHLCCNCNRIIDDPEIIRSFSWDHGSPFVALTGDAPIRCYINIFHLYRYLKSTDQQKADAVRQRLKKLGFPIDEKLLKVFYK